MLAGSATVYNCSGGGNGDNPTNMSLTDFDTITANLATNDAWMMLQRQGGEDKFGKICAEVKSSLIDLETEVAQS